MSEELILTFRGNLSPGQRISARTLSHSLAHLQRAIDKVVIYEKRGKLTKYAQLGSSDYQLADLIVQDFKQGSLKIPLISNGFDHLGKKLSEVLDDPYKKAESSQTRALTPLRSQIADARTRAIYGIGAGLDENEFLKTATQGVGWYKTAVLQDFNHLLSPLRSNAASDKDEIEITLPISSKQSKSYNFNTKKSKAFNSIVTAKKVGPETKFSGTLHGLSEHKSTAFPYSGIFKSKSSGLEVRLLVPSVELALALNQYNLSGRHFEIWAAPLLVYQSFDEERGDIIFLGLVEE